MVIYKNIDIDKAILENINIDIDIDKGIFQNIDIDKISYRLGFGISNTPTEGAVTGQVDIGLHMILRRSKIGQKYVDAHLWAHLFYVFCILGSVFCKK